MIQTIVTHQCPNCGSEDLVRNGHDYKGDQKYHCKTCARYGTLHAQPRYDERLHTQVKRAVLECLSLRGIERVFGLSRRTVADWIGAWAEHLPPLETTLVAAQEEDVLELDEVWSFVLKKANQRWGCGWPCAAAIRARLWLTSPVTHRNQLSATLAMHPTRLHLLTLVQRLLGRLSARVCH